MTESTLQATPKGELPHLKYGTRKSVQIRLPPKEHREMAKTAEKEKRSMSFVALRRYQLGRDVELAEQKK